jgi:hypothetical protein
VAALRETVGHEDEQRRVVKTAKRQALHEGIREGEERNVVVRQHRGGAATAAP